MHLSPKKRTELTKALQEKGVGWFVKYEWNVAMGVWNGYLYSKKLEAKGMIEKAFLYDTPDECLVAICRYKKIKV